MAIFRDNHPQRTLCSHIQKCPNRRFELARLFCMQPMSGAGDFREPRLREKPFNFRAMFETYIVTIRAG